MIRLKREISLLVGGLAIDLICKLTAVTVVLSTNRHVEKDYFLVCSSFNGELYRWFNVVQVILQGLYKARLNRGTYVIDISFSKPRLGEIGGQSWLLQVFHDQVGHNG